MATKKASALKAFITRNLCIVMLGLGWLSDPLIANSEAGLLSRLLAWCCLAAAAIALIVAIYFTFRAPVNWDASLHNRPTAWIGKVDRTIELIP